MSADKYIYHSKQEQTAVRSLKNYTKSKNKLLLGRKAQIPQIVPCHMEGNMSSPVWYLDWSKSLILNCIFQPGSYISDDIGMIYILEWSISIGLLYIWLYR